MKLMYLITLMKRILINKYPAGFEFISFQLPRDDRDSNLAGHVFSKCF